MRSAVVQHLRRQALGSRHRSVTDLLRKHDVAPVLGILHGPRRCETTYSKQEFPTVVPIHMPHVDLPTDGDQFGDTRHPKEHTMNRITAWHKKTGDVIKRNDVLCDIETPSFTFAMVMQDEDDSIMGEILVPADDVDPDDKDAKYVRDGEIICTTYQRQTSVSTATPTEPKKL